MALLDSTNCVFPIVLSFYQISTDVIIYAKRLKWAVSQHFGGSQRGVRPWCQILWRP